MQALSGNWASLLLPINGDDSIDFIRLGAAIDVLIAAGVDGIYSNGTACEFYAHPRRWANPSPPCPRSSGSSAK